MVLPSPYVSVREQPRGPNDHITNSLPADVRQLEGLQVYIYAALHMTYNSEEAPRIPAVSFSQNFFYYHYEALSRRPEI